MEETYVRLKEESERLKEENGGDVLDVYCPIDFKKKAIIRGLTLIGFVPKGAKIVGDFEESTGIFIPISDVNKKTEDK